MITTIIIITIIIIVIMRDNSEKYAGSVMVVLVDKRRTIETRQDVSFIPQTTSDKEASWTFLIDLRSHSPQKRDKNWTKKFQTNKKKKWSLSQPIKKLLDIFDRFMFPQPPKEKKKKLNKKERQKWSLSQICQTPPNKKQLDIF